MCLLLRFRPFTMAENSLVDSKFKGMTHSVPVNPLNHLHIEEPTDTYSTDLLTHLKILRIEKTLSIALLLMVGVVKIPCCRPAWLTTKVP